MMTNQEIAYTILDLLFLYGDPVNSRTFFDDDIENFDDPGMSLIQSSANTTFNAVSQKLGGMQMSSESCQVGCPYTERPKDPKEAPKTSRVHIDRTT